SPGTCSPAQLPAIPTWAVTSTTPGSTPNAASATTSASSKPSATRSPSNPRPDPDQPIQPGSAEAPPGAAARPLTLPFSDQYRANAGRRAVSRSSAVATARRIGPVAGGVAVTSAVTLAGTAGLLNASPTHRSVDQCSVSNLCGSIRFRKSWF